VITIHLLVIQHCRNGDGYDYCVAIGYQSLSNCSASYNTSIGAQALRENEIGTNNVAVGYRALYTLVEGDNNIAIGSNALENNEDSADNIAIGNNALNLINGGNNVAIGSNCLNLSTSGSQNVVIGTNALSSALASNYNVAIGYNALANNEYGDYNIALGVNTSCDSFDYCLVIGTDAVATASNQVVIGTDVNPLGGVNTEVNTSSKYWEVVINGVTEKILLA
jgi:hypothetical protein